MAAETQKEPFLSFPRYLFPSIINRMEASPSDAVANKRELMIATSASSSNAIFLEFNNDSDLCFENHQGVYCYTCAAGTAKRGGECFFFFNPIFFLGINADDHLR